MSRNIESIIIPEEIFPLSEEQLNYIQALYQCNAHCLKSELVLEGKESAVRAAKDLCPGLFLAWKLKAIAPMKIMIQMPMKISLSQEELTSLINDSSITITYNHPKVEIAGNSGNVKLAKSKLEHFLTELKPKSKVTVKTPLKNSRHVEHH